MRLLTRLLAALLLVALAAAPAGADHLQQPYERLVRWAGCEAVLVTDDTESATSSFYVSQLHGLFIGTRPDMPSDLALVIVLHEIAHCLQYQDGSAARIGRGPALELDADRRAAELACALGLDGPRLLHDLFVWAYATLGYVGDEGHGTSAERISQGAAARGACVRPPQQA
jgi:hypothetical protein